MNHAVQFILDQNQKPLFAVLPFESYKKLIDHQDSASDLPSHPSLLSEDGMRVRLPHGGPGAYIDLVRLVDYCMNASLVSMAINARQQALDKFSIDQIASLDPLIRMCFLPKDSPYRNTMQATTEVVDALVETGIFVRSKRSFDAPNSKYYRPVNALDFIVEAGERFLGGKKPSEQINAFYWMKTDRSF